MLFGIIIEVSSFSPLSRCIWGPLILVKGWHPQLLQICSMHVMNLGLGYRCNGSSMLPGWVFGFLQFNILGRFVNPPILALYIIKNLFAHVRPFCFSNPGYAYFASNFGEMNLTSKRPWTQHTCIFELGRRETKFRQPSRHSRPGWCFVLQAGHVFFDVFCFGKVFPTWWFPWNNHESSFWYHPLAS